MNNPQAPDVLFFLASQCPHCPGVLAALSELVKHGVIGRLNVVNIEIHPEAAQELEVRTVPWLQIGPFQLVGARSSAELAMWAQRTTSDQGMNEAFHDLIKQGNLAQVLRLIQAVPERLVALLPIVANPEASLNVKLGVGVVFEEYAGSHELRALGGGLGELTRHADARVRADACHLLSLLNTSEVRPWLQAALHDENAEVREIAAESLQALEGQK